MPMGNVWRLIIHGELSPRLNMDIDEALLLAHARGECTPTLRFYRWSPPAVSLGYLKLSGCCQGLIAASAASRHVWLLHLNWRWDSNSQTNVCR